MLWYLYFFYEGYGIYIENWSGKNIKQWMVK